MHDRYPQEISLRDGRRVLVRPLVEKDTPELTAFFQRLPDSIRRFAWDRVDDPALIQSWGANIDYNKVLPLIALSGTRIVADASMQRRKGGPLRLVGRLSWMIDPEFRSVGLGTILVKHFIDHGREYGLRHLTCMRMTDLEAHSIEVLTNLGFTAYQIPGYGTDPDGGQHDMTKLVLKL